KFSVAHDTATIIPVLQQAKRLQPGLTLLATPWSAPGWMKLGRKLVGSCAGSDPYLNPDFYAAYANYFVKFVRAYQTYGLPISMVSMQNEPKNCNSTYPTMKMESGDQADFAPILYTELDLAGLRSVQILAYDHNWTEQGDSDYPKRVLDS